jgi:hypothetical protein
MLKVWRLFGLLPWLLVVTLALALTGRISLPWIARLSGSPVGLALQAVEEKNDLVVFAASFASITDAAYESPVPGMSSHQTGILRGTVDYRLPLGHFDPSRVAWDANSRSLTLRLPAVQLGQIALDTKDGRYFRSGVFITANQQDAMTRRNAAEAEKDILRQAHSPYLLKLARMAAKNAMQSNVQAALVASGHPDAKIIITIDGE